MDKDALKFTLEKIFQSYLEELREIDLEVARTNLTINVGTPKKDNA